MKFPPILHRPALFCLFGLIVIAVIGGAIHWVGFKEWLRSWQELIGAGIGGAIAGAAIWITTRETRIALVKQLQDRKDARQDEVARNLAILHLALSVEARQIDYVVKRIKVLLAKETEALRRRGISELRRHFVYEHQHIIANSLTNLGDTDPLVGKSLLLFHQGAKAILPVINDTMMAFQTPFDDRTLPEGDTAQRVLKTLALLTTVRSQAEGVIIFIERWLKKNDKFHLLHEDNNDRFTSEEWKRLGPLSNEVDRLQKELMGHEE